MVNKTQDLLLANTNHKNVNFYKFDNSGLSQAPHFSLSNSVSRF